MLYFQLLHCEDVLLFFVLSGRKINIFGQFMLCLYIITWKSMQDYTKKSLLMFDAMNGAPVFCIKSVCSHSSEPLNLLNYHMLLRWYAWEYKSTLSEYNIILNYHPDHNTFLHLSYLFFTFFKCVCWWGEESLKFWNRQYWQKQFV